MAKGLKQSEIEHSQVRLIDKTAGSFSPDLWVQKPAFPITVHEAQMLAELPRNNSRKPLDGATWAAIGGLTASLPSTAHSASDISWAASFSLSIDALTDFAVTLFFLTFLGAIAIFRLTSRDERSTKTSEDYLKELLDQQANDRAKLNELKNNKSISSMHTVLPLKKSR